MRLPRRAARPGAHADGDDVPGESPRPERLSRRWRTSGMPRARSRGCPVSRTARAPPGTMARSSSPAHGCSMRAVEQRTPWRARPHDSAPDRQPVADAAWRHHSHGLPSVSQTVVCDTSERHHGPARSDSRGEYLLALLANKLALRPDVPVERHGVDQDSQDFVENPGPAVALSGPSLVPALSAPGGAFVPRSVRGHPEADRHARQPRGATLRVERAGADTTACRALAPTVLAFVPRGRSAAPGSSAVPTMAAGFDGRTDESR